MQRLEVSGAVRPIYGSLGVKGLMKTSRSILRMRNVSQKRCSENQNKHFMFNTHPPTPESRAFYDIMWKNIVEPHR